MADKQYSTLYNRVVRSLNSIGDTDEDLRREVSRLKLAVEQINNRLLHIYQLLTND